MLHLAPLGVFLFPPLSFISFKPQHVQLVHVSSSNYEYSEKHTVTAHTIIFTGNKYDVAYVSKQLHISQEFLAIPPDAETMYRTLNPTAPCVCGNFSCSSVKRVSLSTGIHPLHSSVKVMMLNNEFRNLALKLRMMVTHVSSLEHFINQSVLRHSSFVLFLCLQSKINWNNLRVCRGF
jgi:hypothetical protein